MPSNHKITSCKKLQQMTNAELPNSQGVADVVPTNLEVVNTQPNKIQSENIRMYLIWNKFFDKIIMLIGLKFPTSSSRLVKHFLK